MNLTGKQKFKVEYNNNDDIYAYIEIDFEHKDIWEIMKESIEFFQSYIIDTNEELVEDFLAHLTRAIIFHNPNGRLTTIGVIDEMKTAEGYPLLDGSCGITLLNTSNIEIEDCDFDVRQM